MDSGVGVGVDIGVGVGDGVGVGVGVGDGGRRLRLPWGRGWRWRRGRRGLLRPIPVVLVARHLRRRQVRGGQRAGEAWRRRRTTSQAGRQRAPAPVHH